MPAWLVIICWKSLEETLHIFVAAGIQQHRIIHIPRFLVPRIEQHFFVTVVRMKRGNYACQRVVKEHGTDAHLPAEFKSMCSAKERFVLPDWFALVIKYGPTACYPSRIDNRCAWNFQAQRTGFGRHLFLNLAPESVRVAEAQLNFESTNWKRI